MLKKRSWLWHVNTQHVNTFTAGGYLEKRGQGLEMHVVMSHRLCSENTQKAVTVALSNSSPTKTFCSKVFGNNGVA